MIMMMFPSRLFIFLTLQLLSYNHNMVTAQCAPNNLETTQVSSKQLTMSWRCFDRDLGDEFKVAYRLYNRGQCDTGDGSEDPPFDYQTTQWGTWNRQDDGDPDTVDTYKHSAALTNLLPYSTYGVSVQARQPYGGGGYNYNSLFVYPNPTTSEAVPGTFGAESITFTPYANQLYFNWTIPCGSRNGLITGFQYWLRDANDDAIEGATTIQDTYVTIIGLSCDTTYRFEVAGTNSAGIGAYSEYNTATTTCCTRGPGSVGNLQTTSISATEIRLSWTAPVDIGCPAQSRLQYVVTYTGDSLQDGCTLPTSQGSTAILDLYHTLSSLTPYYEYTIGVFAVGGEANRQTIIISTLQSVPGAVQTLQITAASSTSIDVSWNAPINKCQHVSYIVATQLTNRDQCLPMTGGPIIPTGSPTGLSYQVTGLIPYSTYTVYVTPVNTAGDGITSDVSGTTAQTVPTVMPTNVALIDTEPSFITFGWDSIPCRSRGGQITYRYQLQLNDGSDRDDRDGTTSGSVTQVTFNDLMCSTGLAFRVRAVTEAGEGLWSQDYITATSLTVTSITFTNTLATELHTTWTVDNRGCGSQPYLVEYMLVNKDQCEPITGGTRMTGGTTMETFFTLTGRLPYSTYQVFVTPMIDGRIGTGMSEQMTTAQSGPTEGPAVTVTKSTANSVAFSWTEVPCGSRGGLVTQYTYRLIRQDGNTIVTDQDTADATQMSVNIPDLELDQMYAFQIAAINEAGTGPSTTITASTIAGPAPPESVTLLEEVSTTSLTFSWNEVSCDDMDACYSIGGYLYRLTNEMGDSIISIGETSASETSVVIPNLQPCTTYRLSVAVKSERGIVGSYSDYVEGSTAIAASPDNVMVTDVSERSLTFTWMKPMCGEETGVITKYPYVFTDNYRATSVMSNTFDTSIAFSDLTPYVIYSFRVAAWSSAGQGPYSDAIEVQTLEDKPPQPMNLVSSKANATSITIQWLRPDPPHGVIVGYEVRYWDSSGSTMNETSRNYYTVSGLQFNDMISFQVRAETRAGKGVWSKTVTAKAVEGVPGIPVNLTAIDIEETSVRLQWKSPMYSNGVILSYPIKYKAIQKTYDSSFVPSDEAYVSPSAILNPDESIQGYTVDNLSPSTKYEFLVAGRTSAGSGENARIEVFTKAFTGLKRPNSPAVKIAKGVGIIAFNDLPEFVSNAYIAVENANDRKRRQVGKHPIHAFIVANLTRKEVEESMTFTLGDNKTYRGYVNHALIGGQSYGIKVAYASCTPEGCLEEWSSLSIFTAPSGTFNQSGTFSQLGPIIGGVVAVILIGVVLIALICYYRRNKASTKETPKETAKDENEIYDVIDPETEMMAKQQQRSQTVETGYEVNIAMEANTSIRPPSDGSAYDDVSIEEETKMSPRAQSDGSAYEDVNIKEEAEYQGLDLDAVDDAQSYQDLKGTTAGDKNAPQCANV